MNGRARDGHGHGNRDWRCRVPLPEVPGRQRVETLGAALISTAGVITRETAVAVSEEHMDLGLWSAAPRGSRKPEERMGPQEVVPKTPRRLVRGKLSASHVSILRLLTSIRLQDVGIHLGLSRWIFA
jgi:hypothetical protein